MSDAQEKIRNFSQLETISGILNLELLHIATGHFEYQALNTFPFNVFYAALSPDPTSILENLSSRERIPAEPELVMIVPRNLKIYRDVHVQNEFFAVHFNLTLPSGADLFDGCSQCLRRRDPGYIERIRRILAESNPTRALCLVESLVLGFSGEMLPETDSHALRMEERYSALLRRLRHTITARTTVIGLAREFGLRPDVFSRNFLRNVGAPPSQKLKQLLAQRISQLLLTRSDPLKVLADELEFYSEYHLSVYFKRQIGVAPSFFRRKFAINTEKK